LKRPPNYFLEYPRRERRGYAKTYRRVQGRGQNPRYEQRTRHDFRRHEFF